MAAQPVSLKLKGNVLTIEWDDGQLREYEVAELRRHCPCATCNTERQRSESGQITLSAPGDELKIAAMHPVGNYGYSIHFSDRHTTGIYPLELLRELGKRSS